MWWLDLGLSHFSDVLHLCYSLANKQDIDGALGEVDSCEYLQLEELVNRNRYQCRVVSTTVVPTVPHPMLSCAFDMLS